MTDRPTSEFNTGVVSPEIARKQWYLAAIGSESLASGFRKVSGMDAEAERKADVTDPGVMMMAEMAAEDQVRRLEERLDRLEQETIEALQENEEKLREAEENLEGIEAAALTITMPDGTVRKVYRDGDRVRFEDGSFADPAIIDADQVSDNEQQWAERESAKQAVADLERGGEKLRDQLDRVQDGQERLDGGRITQDEFEALEAMTVDTSEIVAATRHPEEAAPDEPDALAEKQPAVTSPASTPAPGSGG